jgi:hypothetical protein
MADRTLLHDVEKLASVPVRISRLIGIDRESNVLGNETRLE